MPERLVRVNGCDPKQCRWEFYRGRGPGGQSRNKTSNAARVKHLPSGTMAQASEHKSLHRNRQAAWRRLAATPKFRAWLRVESARASGELAAIEKRVAASMHPRNLRIERKNDEGLWEEWTDA